MVVLKNAEAGNWLLVFVDGSYNRTDWALIFYQASIWLGELIDTIVPSGKIRLPNLQLFLDVELFELIEVFVYLDQAIQQLLVFDGDILVLFHQHVLEVFL